MDILDALIVSHGQPSAPARAEAELARVAERVEAGMPEIRLSSATMAAPGRLKAALGCLRRGGKVYPLFMADGWFVQTALMARLGSASVEVMTPFGMEPDLPQTVAKAILAEAGSGARPSRVLLAAHGSASARLAPARSARDFALALEIALPGVTVEVGFLEQSPSIAEALGDHSKDDLCQPFLAMAGNHMRRDVHAELRRAGFQGRVLPVISQLPGVEKVIGAAIQREVKSDQPRFSQIAS